MSSKLQGTDIVFAARGSSLAAQRYFKTSNLPPDFVIFSWADFENLCA